MLKSFSINAILLQVLGRQIFSVRIHMIWKHTHILYSAFIIGKKCGLVQVKYRELFDHHLTYFVACGTIETESYLYKTGCAHIKYKICKKNIKIDKSSSQKLWYFRNEVTWPINSAFLPFFFSIYICITMVFFS